MIDFGRLRSTIALLPSLAIFSFGFSIPQDDKRADYQRGLALYKEGRYKEAVDAFKRSVQLDPNNADAFYQLGNSYRDSEQIADAIQAYQQALKLKPKWAEALYGLGVAYGMSGRTEEAIKYLKESLALTPTNSKAYYNLGVAYSDLGQFVDAAEAFKKATKLDPKDADNFFNLGVTYQNLNKLKEAEDALANALLLKPSDVQAHYQIALVYVAMGNRGLATIHYLALQQSSPELAQKLRMQLFPTLSLLNKRVTFTFPEEWQVQQKEDGKDLGRVQLLIPYPATDNTPESANAAVIANVVPDNITVKEVGDQVYKKRFDGLAVVNDIPDGTNWRTIVWTAKAGVQYVSLDRFGVANKVAVEFLVSFPVMEKGDPKWSEKLVADFNAVCESLKIDGTNSTGAKVHLDKFLKRN